MTMSRSGWLLLLALPLTSVWAEEVVPLEGAAGDYLATTPAVTFDVDLGFELYRLDAMQIRWSGELTAGWGVLWGGSFCDSTPRPMPASFSATALESLAFAFSPIGEDYPNTESFASVDEFDLFLQNTWDSLIDGQFSVRLLFQLDLLTSCNVTVLEDVSGSLEFAELVIDGARYGDLDADADVDDADREGFASCYSGIDEPAMSGCLAVDFDRDDDVDCADWNRFEQAWTESVLPAPFASCVYPVLEVTPSDLIWSEVESATAYDVVVGDLHVLRQSSGDFVQAVDRCAANDQPSTAIGFTDQPMPGEAWWLLMRAETSGGALTYDSLYPSQVAPRDALIESSTFSCP